MKKLKVISVIGTRPEIIRLSRVLSVLDQSAAIDHIIVHTGQNYDYELNQIFFEELNLRKPDFFLEAAGVSPAETIGNILIRIDPILEAASPDAFLVLGDTNSCLCAIPAKKRKIPIFHMEAGNRCFDQRVPEETNRKIVDHISDINMPYSDIAREYLLNEGLSPDRIIKTGSPIFEVLNFYKDEIDNSKILSELNLTRGAFFVVSAHREENINSERNFSRLIRCLNVVADQYQLPIIVSTHPRTRNKVDEAKVEVSGLVSFLKPMGFYDYNALQKNALAVLSDSGTISEESNILNFRALNIRETHERPESMEEAAVMMVGLSSDRILQGLKELLNQSVGIERNYRLVSDYSMPNVSSKVVRIILSYTDYIKRVVWNEN
ncbi:UDP-N-acetylglucosamine 2-epimerase (non-hydrolyzing) [Marinilongibacter aquaticus]|uniref:non-hydrolyzing UDP-N-acetylglucosamine 2-epimerase n=1 Tax=Marinilongibacter aquaticus TaxID=2975157 RepID=UPI0021BD01BC|nr:UDP-N-acetylglucosamine 2-epimerase (non-hydrolyzing) [Marinilongibacter aquaticus]UBM57645.1 UDP-N-acetylglucosamine 2-epimerase (non-hydrolyzing) [Marinilongibacter aquaticus]